VGADFDLTSVTGMNQYTKQTNKMRKVLKVMGILLGIVMILIAGSLTYVKVALPDTGKPETILISTGAEQVERGSYLANHVTVCMDCHSTRDWSLFTGPMNADSLGAGGEKFNQDMGFPGSFYAPNITPYGLKGWTDGEILRAVTTGVNKEGKALFPIMGAHRFGKMDRRDIYDIIAYLRTIKPIQKNIPESEADFPVNFIINTMPKPANFQKRPAESDSVKYGGYLVNAAGCVECHSKTDKGSIIEGTEFGGGMEFGQPGGVVRSANITFDKASGIGNWNKAAFVGRFKAFAPQNYTPAKLQPGQLNTPMPWTMYAGMKTTDLEAIYAYLESIKPISNTVEKFSAGESR
jgi:mono/diheme cytochrome c family protein